MRIKNMLELNAQKLFHQLRNAPANQIYIHATHIENPRKISFKNRNYQSQRLSYL